MSEQSDIHPDNYAVNCFGVMMKQKLGLSRAKGRHGWQTCTEARLMAMLREHVEKGDMVDVANLAMMIHLNREASKT